MGVREGEGLGMVGWGGGGASGGGRVGSSLLPMVEAG